MRADTWAVTSLALVAAVAGVALLRSPQATALGAPLVSQALVAEALASKAPQRPTMSDDVDHFQARLASRGEEALSRWRLYGAHLLRFRAYGAVSDLEAAGRQLTRLEATRPASNPLRVARSGYQLTRHEFRAALATARAAEATGGVLDPGIRFALFDALWATGSTDEAESLLSLPLERKTVAFLSREARVLDRAGRVHEARDRFREVLRRVRAWAEPAPVEAWALTQLAHFEYHGGDPARAVVLYREALDVLPGDPAALEGLALIARGVDHDLDAAAALTERALDNGGHPDLVAILADLEEARGYPKRATKLRRAFVARAQSDDLQATWARRPLVFVLADGLGRPCDAVVAARRDLSERRDSGAWDALAWSFFQAGDLDAAWTASLEATRGGIPEPRVALHAGLVSAARDGSADARARRFLDIALAGAAELSMKDAAEARRVRGGEVVHVPLRAACGETPR